MATSWAVAGVGLAAVVATVFMLLIQAGLKPVERRFFKKHAQMHRVLLEVDRGADVLEGIQFATNSTLVRLRSMEFDHDGTGTLDTIELALMADRQQDTLGLISRLRKMAAVRHITYK